MIPSHGYDFVQWSPGQRKLYESNYLKANAPDGDRGFWLKHNILAPTDPHRPAVLELWCVLFDKTKGRPRALKQTVPMDEVLVSKTGLRIEGNGILMTDAETRTQVRDPGGAEASWELELTSEEPPVYHFPSNRMYTAPFPKKKMITPAPRVRFDGWIEVDGERLDVEQWIGIRGHNWGSEHAHAYAYGNCNLFVEDASALVDLFTVKIRLGPVKSPWMSMGVLRQGGREVGFRSFRHAVTRRAFVELPRWEVEIRSGAHRLRTEWELDPQQTIGLRYLHPDGAVSYCYNTKFARLSAHLDGGRLTSDQAELEFLYPEAVSGIPLHGDDELP